MFSSEDVGAACIVVRGGGLGNSVQKPAVSGFEKFRKAFATMPEDEPYRTESGSDRMLRSTN